MERDALDTLKEKLDETYVWPCLYPFKFIVKTPQLDEVLALFRGQRTTQRESRGGRYIAVTAELMMDDSASVVAVYRAALKIEGIISL